MNTWQVLRQIKHLLQQQQWPGSSTDVFHDSSVRVTQSATEEAFSKLVSPVVLLRPESAQMDPEFDEQPGLIKQQIAATLCVKVGGDAVGEHTMLGANRVGATDSRGRGLLEIEEMLLDAIERVNDIDGVRILARTRSAVRPQPHTDWTHILFRDYTFEAVCTSDRFYHAATDFSGSVSGSDVTLTWTLPPDRYDRLRVIVRRASGATAPSSPSDGTGITLSGDLATTVTDAPGSGTWSYGIWAAYDEYGAGNEDRYSAAQVDTVTVA